VGVGVRVGVFKMKRTNFIPMSESWTESWSGSWSWDEGWFRSVSWSWSGSWTIPY